MIQHSSTCFTHLQKQLKDKHFSAVFLGHCKSDPENSWKFLPLERCSQSQWNITTRVFKSFWNHLFPSIFFHSPTHIACIPIYESVTQTHPIITRKQRIKLYSHFLVQYDSWQLQRLNTEMVIKLFIEIYQLPKQCIRSLAHCSWLGILRKIWEVRVKIISSKKKKKYLKTEFRIFFRQNKDDGSTPSLLEQKIKIK